FQEDVLPPFAVFAIDEVECSRRRGGVKEAYIMKGHKEAGNHLARELIRGGFDVACSWKLHNRPDYGHAFTSTVEYLDMDGKGFPHPIVPLAVNCYGSDMRIPGPGRTPIRGRILQDVEDPPPPSPMPWRCYDLGKEVGRIIGE